MAKTLIIQCTLSKEFATYGWVPDSLNVLGDSGIIYLQEWCPIDQQKHQSQAVVISVPDNAELGAELDQLERNTAIELFNSGLPTVIPDKIIAHKIGHRI